MKSALIIGLGHFGINIAMELVKLNREVMAVDNDEKRVQDALSFIDDAQIGDSTNREFLESLGVDNFDVVIVTIGNDFQSSLETTWLLKELGAKKVIARASRHLQEKFLLKNGADEVVYPQKQLARWTAMRCTSEHILDFMEIDEDNAVVEIDTPKEWSTKSILKLDIRKHYGVTVLGVKEKERYNFQIGPDFIMEEDKKLLIFGSQKSIQKLVER